MLDVHEQNKIDVVAKRMKLSKNETSFFFCLQKCVEKNIFMKKTIKKNAWQSGACYWFNSLGSA